MNTLSTAREVAAWLKLQPRAVLRLAASGAIPCYRLGYKVVRFDMEKVKNAVLETEVK